MSTITDPVTGEVHYAPKMARPEPPTSSYLYACEFPSTAPAVAEHTYTKPVDPILSTAKVYGLLAGVLIGGLLLIEAFGMKVMYG